MNYIGRLVTNVRGFYSEINSATLTGAIDVVVIRQEDGSFMGSPFHVRFGKLGVLRSREKIVDIEVNGNPVPLHMKLGDAGEAFFVEEIEEPLDSRSEMACSPIPPTDNMDDTIEEVEEYKDEENINDQGQEEVKRKDSETSKADPQEDSSTVIISVIETDEAATTEETREGDKEKDVESLSINTDIPTETLLLKVKADEETTDKVEDTEVVSIDTEEVVKSQDGNNSDPETGEEMVASTESRSTELSTKPSTDSQSTELSTERSTETSTEQSTELSTEPEGPVGESSRKISLDVEMEGDAPDAGDSTNVEDDVVGSFSVSDSISIPGREIFSDSDSSNWMMDSTSLPEEHPFRQDHLYPLSDLDSPIGSPPDGCNIHMRPNMVINPQHCLSDTEVEIKQSQDNNSRDDEVTWDWGKLPQGREHVYPIDRKIQDLKREETSYIHRAKRKDHKIKEEGIYLDDLPSVDDEVARLYLNQALKSRKQKETPMTEVDRESGIGQSLPSSPCTEESGQKDTSLDTYQDMAMSLCGELKNGKVLLESFMKHMVTFEDFSNDPSLLTNPKLVIRINERYYNWQIAAPMLISYIVYQRPLEKEALQMLIKQHMPKKEKRRSYYWFSWRQQQDDQSSDDEDQDIMKEKHRPRVHSSSRKHYSTAPTEAALLQREGEGEGEGDNEPFQDQVPQRRERNVSECTSGNESDMVNYRKTTRLSSEQLANLSLREGPNSIEFSVTTKYQGTAACQATIYLWNYDDRIVISDIDGTITKSDVLGQILPVVGSSWAQSGVANFFTSIEKNGYKLLYLSARAIGQAQLTREYLKSVKQDQICLPDGPLLLSPSSLIKAFHREVIEKKPEEFKISALRDIRSLFPQTKNPFYGGFGNKVNDVYSYRAVGVSISRIFTINHKGEVTNELTTTYQTSYLRLWDLVDQMFPPYKKQQDSVSTRPLGLVAPDEFSSFTYWRNPLPEVDTEGFQGGEPEVKETTEES